MDAETWTMHRDTGMVCCCFSSQANGFFSKLDAGGPDAVPDHVKAEFLTEENLECFRRVRQVREETGLGVASVALAYLTCQPFPTFALVGASRMEHIDALREAGDAVLTDAQRDLLRRIG